MNKNDIIAEYIKERYPELLNTTDFALYKFSCACRKIVDGLKEAFGNIDFSELLDQLKESDSVDK